MPLENENSAHTAHVLVIGGGFAGVQCTMRLAAHPNIRVTLIDKKNYQQFHPLLYQVATSILSPGNAAFALRDMFRDHDNVDVQMEEVVSLDLAGPSATIPSGKTHHADYLVLATGSEVNFYGVPGAREHSFPLYSLIDAEKLRSTILLAFEAADRDPDDANQGLLNFVVVGGGPTGVEMAGTLSDMLKRVLQKEFRHVAGARPQVFLIEATPSVLGTFSQESQRYAASALARHDVKVLLSTSAKEVTPEGVPLSDGSFIASKTVVWAAGIKASGISTLPELVKRPDGRIDVEADLSIPGFPRVFVAGDLANAADETGTPVPQLAAAAQQSGRSCAANILASLAGKPSKPFLYADRGILAMIGRNSAIAELGKRHHQIDGPVAFLVWLGVHAALLGVARARLESLVEWTWEYFGGEHAGQLIDR